jgi:signal transduction histidine kinase
LKSKGKEKASSSSSYPSSRTSSATASTRSGFSSLISILRNRTFIFYTLIPAILLSIITILSTDLDAWNLSEIHHFYIELFAVILGSILAFYYIARARTLNDNFSRFVGFGFLVAALIDLLHVTISYVFMDDVTFLKYFIPQTWFAGRIFLSAMLVIAIAKYPTFSGEEKKSSGDRLSEAGPRARTRIKQEDEYIEEQGKEEENKSNQESSNALTADDANRSYRSFGVYLTILAVLAGSVAISSLYLVLPYSVIDEILLHRPYEIPSLVLFIIALILFYKNQLYKKTDVFYKGILAYLIIDIYAQIIMSYSAMSFDTPHNVAHILKDAGYFVNIIALALSSIQYNVQLRESNKSLIEGNVRLKEGEEVIRIQYERLKESEKMKDEFINTAAHELRTPIQPILGLTEIIRSRITTLDGKSDRSNDDGDNANKKSEGVVLLLDVIIRNAKRLKQLTDNILDVTKIESHSFKLNKEQFNIGQLIEETVEEQNIRISDTINTKTKIEILCMVANKETDDIAITSNASTSAATTATSVNAETVEYDVASDNNDEANAGSDSFLVEADRTKISQVVSNLLSNALSSIRLKDGTKEGRISISISKRDKKKTKSVIGIAEKGHDQSNNTDEITVSIKDNGQGIPPDVAPNLFTKFVSGSDSGTGLGLYISKNIIEAHGGRIWASNNDAAAASAAEDGTTASTCSGATFSFTLPIFKKLLRSPTSNNKLTVSRT